mmetsp:Transcript_4814/g.13392  ORF Transcript_4814/g.13392 Transcript_4814/m.13392 type:complete len:208 (+) Transcript_4814:1421-2044(+)
MSRPISPRVVRTFCIHILVPSCSLLAIPASTRIVIVSPVRIAFWLPRITPSTSIVVTLKRRFGHVVAVHLTCAVLLVSPPVLGVPSSTGLFHRHVGVVTCCRIVVIGIRDIVSILLEAVILCICFPWRRTAVKKPLDQPARKHVTLTSCNEVLSSQGLPAVRAEVHLISPDGRVVALHRALEAIEVRCRHQAPNLDVGANREVNASH